MDSRTWRQIAIVLAVLASGVVLSAIAGTPNQLPAASFGWASLLHLERSAAFIGIAAAVLLTGVRALNGRFPVRFGQMEYAADERDQEVEIVHQLHEQRLRTIEAQLKLWERRSDTPSDLRQQI